MSARSAAAHTADELTYRGIRGEVAVWSAPSKSKPGQHNVIVRDTVTGGCHCDCTGAATGRECWHMTLIETCWAMRAVAPFVASLSDDELLAAGKSAKARHEVGGTRTDLLVWLQCRAEWKARERAAQAALAPVVALVVERMEVAA